MVPTEVFKKKKKKTLCLPSGKYCSFSSAYKPRVWLMPSYQDSTVVSHQAGRWPSESSELSRQQRVQEMWLLNVINIALGLVFEGRTKEGGEQEHEGSCFFCKSTFFLCGLRQIILLPRLHTVFSSFLSSNREATMKRQSYHWLM